MNELEVLQSDWKHRLLYKLINILLFVPRRVKQLALLLPGAIKKWYNKTKQGFIDFGERFRDGDLFVRMSYFIMGAGTIKYKQTAKGFLFFLAQLLYIILLAAPVFDGHSGGYYIGKFFTLGTEKSQVWQTPNGNDYTVAGDNSTMILLFGLVTILLTVIFISLYVASTKSAYNNYIMCSSGKTPRTFKQDIKDLLDHKFYVTLLSLPSVGTMVLTILPLIFMILIAFTSFGKGSLPPNELFTWVGFSNFAAIFNMSVNGKVFFSVLGWTMVWAFFATFSNYFLGIIVALLINKKGIKFKKLWRTVLVVTAAVPQFVTLLLMNLMLNVDGPINAVLLNMGLIKSKIGFLETTGMARLSVILVNIWIGIPYTMLITTGILLNIPADLYESARIDGANPVRMFFSITLPYILFVTSPYLISQFIGNINNFNVIFLLTGGGPVLDGGGAGKTDLLVTWLYKLTKDQQLYQLASAIGIIIFIISAVIGLFAYSGTAAYNKEEEFS